MRLFNWVSKLINYVFNKETSPIVLDYYFDRTKSHHYYELIVVINKKHEICVVKDELLFKYYNILKKDWESYSNSRLVNYKVSVDGSGNQVITFKLHICDLYNMYDKQVFIDICVGGHYIPIDVSKQLNKQDNIINNITLNFKRIAQIK